MPIKQALSGACHRQKTVQKYKQEYRHQLRQEHPVPVPGKNNAIQLDVRENVRFVIEFFQKYQKSYL